MEKIKTPVLFVVTVFTVAFIWAFVSENSYRSRATTDQVLVYFATESKNGGVLSLPITLQPDSTQTVSGAQITVTYDKTKVKFISTSETSTVCQSLNTSVKINSSSDEGKLSWTKVNTGTDLPGALPFCFATLKFNMIATGGAQFAISASSSEVVGPGPKAYAVTTNDSSTKTVTITDDDITAVTGNTTLDLKLKLQGVVKKPASGEETIDVLVKLMSNDATINSENMGSFTADDNGIWSGSVNLSATAGANYKVFVKGPKHLQKRVCDATPTETYPGSYHCDQGNITLNTGNNSLDFSGIYMLVGDLPDQDGVVNSYDTSLVRNNLAKTDSATLQMADLNFDGIVDTQDYSLIISALSIRGDEGE